jgi:hypothetical protein
MYDAGVKHDRVATLGAWAMWGADMRRMFADVARLAHTPAGTSVLDVPCGGAVADSKQTLLCTYLSGVLLVGLLLNSVLRWSWADPIVALIIAAVATREGRAAWRGDHCC